MRLIWRDGEQIPEKHLKDIFRQPPDVPIHFGRNAVLVGARGAGKTTFLRFHAQEHEGLALYLSLSTVYAAISKQSATGPLATHLTPDLERQLEHKAAALLMLAIAKHVAELPIRSRVDLLEEIVPGGRSGMVLGELKRLATRAHLNEFGLTEYEEILREFVVETGTAVAASHGQLLLLLDRADTVPAATLRPVFRLLDQAPSYIALVAIRPGHGGTALRGISEHIVPDDHYDVFQLGLTPRSADWLEFLITAASAQIDGLSDCGEELLRYGALLCRDSARLALEVFARLASAMSSADAEAKLQAALYDRREAHLGSLQKLLRGVHPDFRGFVRSIRSEVQQNGAVTHPVVVEFTRSERKKLFRTHDRLLSFIESTFRAGGLCSAPGEKWMPGAVPERFEIAPLYLWDRADPPLVADGSFHIVQRPEPAVFSGGGAAIVPRDIFVSYRFTMPESKKFLNELREMFEARPQLQRWRLITGETVAGSQWPDDIRARIKAADVVVADVTGFRNDVMLEIGFATGLGRPVIPVVAHEADREHLPFWILRSQVGTYDSTEGMLGILNSIDNFSTDPDYVRLRKLPTPSPTAGVLLADYDWASDIREEFEATMLREGLKPYFVSSESLDSDAIERAALASVVIITLDGSVRDAFMHFVCGVILAVPHAGGGRQRVLRKILLVEKGNSTGRYSSTTLRYCTPTASAISHSDVASAIRAYASAYREWNSKSRADLTAKPRRGRNASPRKR